MSDVLHLYSQQEVPAVLVPTDVWLRTEQELYFTTVKRQDDIASIIKYSRRIHFHKVIMETYTQKS